MCICAIIPTPLLFPIINNNFIYSNFLYFKLLFMKYIFIKGCIMKNKRIIKTTTIIIVILLYIWYAKLPDYQEFSSTTFSTGNRKDTTIKIIVYKAHYNPYLYHMIANRYNDLNGAPTKLKLELFFSKNAILRGKKPYRTIIFDYGNHIEYILLDKIP